MKRLHTALEAWMQKEMDVLEFVKAGSYENNLLKAFGQLNGIPQYVKLTKYNELYEVPNYTQIVEDANELASIKPETLVLYVSETPNEFTVPEISESEVSEIVEKHSIYLHTLKEYKIYSAVGSLCQFINFINIDLNLSGYGTTLGGKKIRDFMPVDLHQYIVPTDVEKPVWAVDPKKFKYKYG